MKTVYVIGTCDTKREELAYVRDRVGDLDVPTVLVEVGTRSGGGRRHPGPAAGAPPGWRADTIGRPGRGGRRDVGGSRGVCAGPRRRDRGGVIGIGGSGGTALITPAMRVLPVGVPKVMISTVASGDVSAYVGPSDIAMTYSVIDVAGLNRISRVVLGNAAHAIAGMVAQPIAAAQDDKPAVGLTMFGVTTPLVTMLADRLGEHWDPLVFHATGIGGQSMEKLVDSGQITTLLDSTTTEIADHVGGGVFSAGPARLDVALARTGVPYVGSAGACDMVNFGAEDTVPAPYADRGSAILVSLRRRGWLGGRGGG